MTENDWLAEQFEAQRNHLRAVAYRMLGSQSEADDAVQEAWLNLSRTGANGVENMGGWLTTVVARVCLDMLRSRKSRREDSLEIHTPDTLTKSEEGVDPEQEILLTESVGLALLVVLETLTPAERLAFVLHDMFAVPFDEIAEIVGRSPTAVRQLASRARRRVRGTDSEAVSEATHNRQREIVAAFLAASRNGDFNALLNVLDPEAVAFADHAAVAMGGTVEETRGAKAVAQIFVGRAIHIQPALVDQIPGLTWAPGKRPRVVFQFTFNADKIAEIRLIADPEHIRQLDITLL